MVGFVYFQNTSFSLILVSEREKECMYARTYIHMSVYMCVYIYTLAQMPPYWAVFKLAPVDGS